MDSNELMKVASFPELEFEESTHTYRLHGEEIPSVSDLLEPLKGHSYEGISDEVLERAARKGTSVHNSIENWIKYGIEDVTPEYRGYFDAFIDWWNEYKPEVIGSEIRVYHPLLKYAGTLDLLARINGKVVLIDFKTTYKVIEMTCRIQLQGYEEALAAHGYKVDEKHILQLKPNGKWNYPLFQAKDPIACRVFGGLKSLYDYIKSYK